MPPWGALSGSSTLKVRPSVNEPLSLEPSTTPWPPSRFQPGSLGTIAVAPPSGVRYGLSAKPPPPPAGARRATPPLAEPPTRSTSAVDSAAAVGARPVVTSRRSPARRTTKVSRPAAPSTAAVSASSPLFLETTLPPICRSSASPYAAGLAPVTARENVIVRSPCFST